MNRRQPQQLLAQPLFSTSGPADLTRRRPSASIDHVLNPARHARTLEEISLTQLARESFEAGFAVGTAEALSGRAPSEEKRPTAIRDEPNAQCTSSDAQSDPVRMLTPRRLEVLRLVARGLTNREIASVLGISANTVKAHLTSILETLDLTNRTEAAMAFHDYETDRLAALPKKPQR